MINRHKKIRFDSLCHFGQVSIFYLTYLTPMDAHEHPLHNKHHWWLINLPIFVHCQRLIARKVAELVGFNRVIWSFYAACCFDELSRRSVSCLLNACFKTAVSQYYNLICWAKIATMPGKWFIRCRLVHEVCVFIECSFSPYDNFALHSHIGFSDQSPAHWCGCFSHHEVQEILSRA